MSVNQLIIDVESLRAVSDAISAYMNSSRSNLDDAIRALQAAEGNWSDEDMQELQDALSMFIEEIEDVSAKGLALTERCNKKLAALEQLHSMTI